jgi:hypothetical protein
MDSRQALIARGDRTAALLFEMSQEGLPSRRARRGCRVLAPLLKRCPHQRL